MINYNIKNKYNIITNIIYNIINYIKNNNYKKPFLFSFCSDFLLYYSLYISFFTSTFNVSQIGLLLLISYLSKMIFDYPVVYISDIYSRRNFLIFALISKIFVCCIWLCNLPFIYCIISMILLGFSNSVLWTQTWNYFFDYLKHVNYKSCQQPQTNKTSLFYGHY